MKKTYTLLLLVLLLFTGVNCQQAKSLGNELIQTKEKQDFSKWTKISDTSKRKVFQITKEDFSYELIVYSFEPTNISMSIHNDQNAKRFDQWIDDLSPNLLINGGYFDEKNQPTGYLVIDGEEIGSKKYDSDKSGLLLINNGQPKIVDTSISEIPANKKGLSLMQSFPLLIKTGGQPAIKEDSHKIARRTVLAQSADNFYLIFIDQTPISLYELMNVLIDSDLEIDIALNLDGGQSSSLHASFDNFQESLLPLVALPQVISVNEK